MYNKKNPKILNEFLNYLLAIKSYSINTIKEYNRDLLMFFDFIKEYRNFKIRVEDFNQLILLQIKTADIIAFLVYCNYTRDNNSSTRERKLAAIKSFFKWLLGNYPDNISVINPADEIKSINKCIRLPKYLNLEQSKQIQEVFNVSNSKYPIRNNAMIALFLSSGLRVSELISIRMKDINFSNKSIQIIGKGNKQRTVFFSEYCKKQLNQYIALRNKNNKITNLNEPLFLSSQKRKMSRNTAYNICKQAFINIGINEPHYSPHTLRHTAATLLYIHVKPDILLIKEFLGHSSISSTEIYSHIEDPEVRNAVERNPLSNFMVKSDYKKAA